MKIVTVDMPAGPMTVQVSDSAAAETSTPAPASSPPTQAPAPTPPSADPASPGAPRVKPADDTPAEAADDSAG